MTPARLSEVRGHSLLAIDRERGGESGEAWRPLHWSLPPGGSFGPDSVGIESRKPLRHGDELRPESDVWVLHPTMLPLRRAARVSIELPSRVETRRLGLYRESSDGWEWIGSSIETQGARRAIGGESRRLGAFAVLRDVRAPRVTVASPPRSISSSNDYSKWALEATLEEEGSGVVARETFFTVDGKRVPSEWDPEVRTLRWRPLRAAARGRHRWEVVARDRVGNTTRRSGTFVLD